MVETENPTLREVRTALQEGDKPRARDLLTALLKQEPKSAEYWVWMSAAVETRKERVYCLQTALKFDPTNPAAKKGLIFLGELPPDDTLTPYTIPKTPLWKERIEKELREEKPHGMEIPAIRAAVVLAGIFAAIFLLAGGGFLYNRVKTAPTHTPTRRPPVTLTFTPTQTPAFRTPTPTFLGVTPLAYFLPEPYTPTPLYVLTEHPVLTRASFEAGLRSLGLGNYDTARIQFRDVLKSEPDAPDVYYYLGESYRLQGDYALSLDAYLKALEKDEDFAPGHLGVAKVTLLLDEEADVLPELNAAIRLDPLYAEAYVARGAYYAEGNPKAAITDLEKALELQPGSAVAYMYLAEADLALGENQDALEAGLLANQIDMTLVPVYLDLARAYLSLGDVTQAHSMLQTYSIYATREEKNSLKLATTYNLLGDYESALDVLNRVINKTPHNAEALYQRGMAYLNLNFPKLAEADFNAAILLDENDFDFHIGLARAFFDLEEPGTAYIQVEKSALPLAKKDYQKAEAYYWSATFLEAIQTPQSQAGARNYWQKLVLLPESVVPADWMNQATQFLRITPTVTNTPQPTQSATPSFTQASQTTTPSMTP